MIVIRWMTGKRAFRKRILHNGLRFGWGYFLWLVVVSALIVSAGACSKQPPTTQTSLTTPGSAAPTLAGNENRGQVEEDHPVVTFAGYAWERSLYDPLIEEFNQQNESITVQFVELPEWTAEDQPEGGNYLRAQAVAADTIAVYGGTPEVGVYFRDLQPLVESDPSFDVEDFWPGMLNGCTDSEGRLIGIPLNAQMTVLFYDEAAFDAAGLPYPAPGWTWDDFQRATKALTRKEAGNIRYGFAEQGYIFNSVLSNWVDAHLIENDGEPDGESLLNSIQWYLDLVRSGSIYSLYLSENWEQDWQNWENLFKSKQRPAMWVGDLGIHMPGTDWIYSESNPFEGAAIEVDGVAPFPVAADGSMENTNPVWLECVGISAGTTHPRAAWTWLAYLSHQRILRNQTDAYELTRVPARQSVADSSGFWEPLPDKMEPTVRYALEHAWYWTGDWQAMDAVSQALRQELSGKGNFVDALNDRMAELASTPQPTPDTSSITVATPRPTLSADMTVVDYFANIYGPDAVALKALIETYQKDHPGIAINLGTELSNLPMGTDPIEFLEDEYDCFAWYPPDLKSSEPENLLNLSPFIQAEGTGFIQDFNPALLDPFRFDGEFYGLPASSQPQVMVYNRDLLVKRGVELPGMDWTFDDFQRILSQVASLSETDPSYGYILSEWDNYMMQGRGVRGYYSSVDPPVAAFDNPEMLSALEWLKSLVETNALLLQTQNNWMVIQETMTSGKLAFWPSQAGYETNMFSGPGQKPPYEIGVLPMPLIPNSSEPQSWTSSQGYFIARASQDAQACWDWIRFLSEQPTGFSGVPGRRSVAESPAWEARVGADNASVYRTVLARVQPQNIVAESPLVWPFYTWQSQAVADVLKGEEPAVVLGEAQQKAETFLACMEPVEIDQLGNEELFEEVNACARQADPEGQWQG